MRASSPHIALMKCCRPLITRDAALARMARRSRLPPFRKIVIAKIELLGLPNFCFEVEVRDKRQTRMVRVAVEAVEGNVAVLEPEVEFIDTDAFTAVPAVLREDAAEIKIQSDYRWTLLAAGLKDRKHYRITAVARAGLFYYPYWIGYRMRSGKWDFELTDAVSGMAQGPAMRRAVLKGICILEEEKSRTETQRHGE